MTFEYGHAEYVRIYEKIREENESEYSWVFNALFNIYSQKKGTKAVTGAVPFLKVHFYVLIYAL